MAYLSDDLKEIGQPDALSLFTVPPNQVAVEKIYYNECRPISSFTSDDAPIDIAVPGDGNAYVDLRRNRLYMKCKIVKSDGTLLSPLEETGIINMPLQTMWSQIDVFMNSKWVSLNTNYYPWKAYLKQILSSGYDVADSQLQSQLFYLDDPDLDDVDPYNGSNGGLTSRYGFTQQSREFDLEGPLYEDIFRLNKYLVNGINLQLKFYRNKAPFMILSKEASPSYKVMILDMVFKACMIKVDSGVLINHAQILKDHTAKYTFTRTEVKMQTVPTGSGAFIWQNVWSNNLPSKAFFVFVKQAAVNGDYTRNPFNFLNLASEVALFMNGESIPARPMKIDVGDNQNYVTPYVNLFEVSELWNRDAGLQITRETFGKGFTIYAFCLSPCALGDEYINLVRQGNIRFETKFNTATTDTLNCIAYAEFPALIEVDHTRDIKYTQV